MAFCSYEHSGERKAMCLEGEREIKYNIGPYPHLNPGCCSYCGICPTALTHQGAPTGFILIQS